jgi:hypothetical protein
MDEIGERLLPIDEDDGDPLAVTLLELGIPGDVDLFELEGDVLADAREHATRVLAEMAAGGSVKRQAMDRAHG